MKSEAAALDISWASVVRGAQWFSACSAAYGCMGPTCGQKEKDEEEEEEEEDKEE